MDEELELYKDVILKYISVEVDGESTLVFAVPSLSDGERHEMIQAILDSNPVLRLVDNVHVGQIWDGEKYI